LASLRFIWVIPALWPLIRDRRLLVGAVVVGFLLGNVSQLELWAGHHFGIHALAFKELSPGGRNPGWWTHPAEAGYILVGALGLHLPAAMMGRGRLRWMAVGGCAASWLGMIATGTRGAWIAGLALMLLGAVLAVASGRWKWRSARWGLVGLAAVIAVGWFSVGGFVSRRAGEGLSDVRTALAEHRYNTDTGARIKLALMAVEMFERRPLIGWGAGSYEPHAREVLKSEGADLDWWADRPGSAHNAWLHIAATLGLVGVAIAAGFAWFALRGGFEGWREEIGTYALGPGFALLGLLLTTPFDVTYLNSVPSAFLATMLALCLSGRPRRLANPADRSPAEGQGR
jgi:O-antigen ligase